MPQFPFIRRLLRHPVARRNAHILCAVHCGRGFTDELVQRAGRRPDKPFAERVREWGLIGKLKIKALAKRTGKRDKNCLP